MDAIRQPSWSALKGKEIYKALSFQLAIVTSTGLLVVQRRALIDLNYVELHMYWETVS